MKSESKTDFIKRFRELRRLILSGEPERIWDVEYLLIAAVYDNEYDDKDADYGRFPGGYGLTDPLDAEIGPL